LTVTPDPDPLLRLRLLATSDLHAHLMPWDYYLDEPLEGFGLARVATLISAARAEAANCLFFDNGDLIEGSPLAEYALRGARDEEVHPMIAALNALQCDVATLGNHEFSYGVGFLRGVLRGARYPVVSANVLARNGADETQWVHFTAPWAMLDRVFVDDTGARHAVRVGVFGLTPPQVLDWDKAVLAGAIDARNMVEAAAEAIGQIRASGADIVVGLAHTGVGQADGPTTVENLGAQIAALPGLDALVLGHEHLVFPAAGKPGFLGSIPVVMPGAYGSHLGVIDLTLRRKGAGWSVEGAAAECRAIATRSAYGHAVGLVAPDAGIVAQAADAHQGARQWMGQVVGQSAVPLNSYFALAKPNAVQALIAEAQAAHLAELVMGTRYEGLPMLSAAAPFKAGGRGGPEFYTAVPAGPLLLRNAADLYLHPNRFAAICITGAGIREWLERAATAYNQVRAGGQDQPLLNPLYPATCLEMIAGLSYRIDLAAEARYDAPTGGRIGDGRRICDLTFQGKPVDDAMNFALATNSHRLGVLQHIMGDAACEVIVDGAGTLGSRDVLLRHIARSHVTPAPQPMQWAFRPMMGTSVVLDTSPAAVGHVAEIADFAPESLGLTEAGFLRFRLHL
jgi:2',3'-cyclic-nucleotide 2'-phosphodiesterase / 3'-nucleotidase